MTTEQCGSYLSTSGQLDVRLFDISPDCIKIIDLDGRLQRLNPGAADALELDELSVLHGQRWETLWPIDAQQLVARSVTKALAGERTQFSGFCPTAKGTPKWWDVVVYPIRDSTGAVCEVMAISRDVTELSLARVELEEAARHKDDFLLLLAHELRNPLSAAGMAATLLQRQPHDTDRVRECGQVVSRQIAHMSRLIEDMIDLGRVARGEVTLAMARFDMRNIVADVLEQLQPLIDAKQHTLAVDIDSAACMVLGDRVRLIQAFGNLLGNATRYTPEAGHIRISMHLQAGDIHLTIRDNGIGISADNLARIFDRYAQVNRITERKNSGLGLGLTLVDKLAELHGGSVTAHSDGEGKGSSFTLILPQAK